ncbi:MAG: hypothetical protein M1815_006235 [Lichina confinis]|nr:MAG: hypothetical protein M1815_006235 [Lichina confinis]
MTLVRVHGRADLHDSEALLAISGGDPAVATVEKKKYIGVRKAVMPRVRDSSQRKAKRKHLRSCGVREEQPFVHAHAVARVMSDHKGSAGARGALPDDVFHETTDHKIREFFVLLEDNLNRRGISQRVDEGRERLPISFCSAIVKTEPDVEGYHIAISFRPVSDGVLKDPVAKEGPTRLITGAGRYLSG